MRKTTWMLAVAALMLAGCGDTKQIKELQTEVDEAQATADEAHHP